VEKLFEKQRTNVYYSWLSFIEDFWKSLLVCFLMGHSVVVTVHTDETSKAFNSVLRVYNSVSGTTCTYQWPHQVRMRTRSDI